MLIAARNAFMTRLLPYDAELEYLESTGTQWIDTGYALNTDTDVLSIVYQNTSTLNHKWIWGSYEAKASVGCSSAIISAPTVWYKDAISVAKDAQYNSPHTLIFDANGASNDGVVLSSFKSIVGTYNLYLFALNRNNSGLVSDYFGYAMIYGYKHRRNGVLVRDFIPVRVGTTGYLYDRVTKRLFGNQGTGDFVLGPDVVPVEWLESHGTEYIDTGVPLNLQHSIRCVFQETNTSTYYPGVVSGRGTSPTPAHLRTYTILSPRFDYWNGDEANPGIIHRNLTRGELLELHAVADIENATLNVFVNGVKSGATILLQAGTTPNSVLLFRDTRNVDNFIGRLHLFQELDGSVTVRSFRPVRVGSGSTWEGAMMDVLSRRVYRNAGTGAFTWGNDLKYPIPRE